MHQRKNSNHTWIRTILPIILIGALSACAGKPKLEKRSSDNNSLVFGYIDISSMDVKTTWTSIKRVFPQQDKPYYKMGVLRGEINDNKYGAIIFNEDLPFGSYKVTRISGHYWSFLSKYGVRYGFPEAGSTQLSVRINKPGIYYLGAYKLKRVGSSWAWNEKFELIEDKSISRKNVLKALLKITTNPEWKMKIKKELNLHEI